MTRPRLKSSEQLYDIIESVHSHGILFDSREIFIHGETGDNNEDSGVDFRMATKFLKNMRILEEVSHDPIVIHQHSVGGDWDSGILIYDTIVNCPCHVTIMLHGSACSMGSVIPQAADLRIIMPHCICLIHSGTINVSGTHKQVQSWNEVSKEIYKHMVDIYSSVAVNGKYFQEHGANIDTVRKYIMAKLDKKEDWWLFAEDFVDFGFADAILGYENYENLDIIRKKHFL